MGTTSYRRSTAAVGLALTIVVAGLLYMVVPARADGTQIYASRAEYASSQKATQAYPNPQYPNHKPLRGTYPGSYASTASTPAQPASSHFDWRAAAVGAAGMLGLTLVLAAARATARMTRDRRRRIPFVVDVRDDTPTTG
jgi:hypothetical protein